MLETLGLLPAVAGVNHDGVSSRAFGEKGFEYDGRNGQRAWVASGCERRWARLKVMVASNGAVVLGEANWRTTVVVFDEYGILLE
ncbi:hypothetical protein M0R45_022802 [Rubus argutus]|uniref:Uncharacterized protein n=1 Tax=Rubus argutus TaxID=59490 RepID=A0AAW1XI51_RUBAR